MFEGQGRFETARSGVRSQAHFQAPRLSPYKVRTRQPKPRRSPRRKARGGEQGSHQAIANLVARWEVGLRRFSPIAARPYDGPLTIPQRTLSLHGHRAFNRPCRVAANRSTCWEAAEGHPMRGPIQIACGSYTGRRILRPVLFLKSHCGICVRRSCGPKSADPRLPIITGRLQSNSLYPHPLLLSCGVATVSSTRSGSICREIVQRTKGSRRSYGRVASRRWPDGSYLSLAR